jgi:D-alanyl-D-alanine carboxypeptidase (penicillin-binding protein 5/6)
MFNSYFINASGLPTPPGQYSTAKDLAILANAAMKRPVIREAVGTRGMIFRFADGSTKKIYNTNQVLRGNPYCNGCKTGYTSEAGRCLVSSASDGRNSVIAVILGSETPHVWTESDALLRYGLGH